jgi:PHD/YefM family antitoxin component YafN of YafNO toxin-antitoxin module
MNTLPASEVKRRGVAALEEGLKCGPLHIIKNNRPVCVVLSEEEYRALTLMKEPQTSGKTLLEMMLEKPATGMRTKEEIDAWVEAERDSWDPL